MIDYPNWDRQFAETPHETQTRWQNTRTKRIAQGKCWQCAKPIADCQCPNVSHPIPPNVDLVASLKIILNMARKIDAVGMTDIRDKLRDAISKARG